MTAHSLAVYLVFGAGYGFAAAVQPGPFQTYLISRSLSNGWRRTLPAALAPLISDGPIIAVSLLILSQVPGWLQRALNCAGGLFVLCLAYGAFGHWRKFDPDRPLVRPPARQGVVSAALVNVLNPNPYLYWTLVAGPLLFAGWRHGPATGAAFLLSFYAAIVGCQSLLIVGFGSARKLGTRIDRALLGLSVVALACFGLYQLSLAFRGA